MATTKLPTKQLGKNGPFVPRLGLGCMGLSIWYGDAPNDEDRFALLDSAHARGETFWFTRTNLRLSIFLTTKFGFTPGNPHDLRTLCTDPEYVHQACAHSLLVLGVSKIDLYMTHRLDDVTPIEKTVQAMVELKNEGKIDYFGFSEISASSWRRANKVHQMTAVDVEYSAFSLDIESEQVDLLRTCRELGVAVIAYTPLGRGLLTGLYKSLDDFDQKDARVKVMTRFSKDNFPKNLELVSKIEELARKKGITAAQLSLAWLLKQGDDIFPIPGTKKIERLEENLGALDVNLTAEEEREMRALVNAAEVHGARYPEAVVGQLSRDSPGLS